MDKTRFEMRGISGIMPRLLWCLITIFSAVIFLSNWFDLRFIKIFGIVANGGTLIFPLTFFLTNLIAEVYGYKYARFAIWWGFLFNLIFVVYGQLVVMLPSPDFQTNNEFFDALVTSNNRTVLAGLISYFCSEPLNSFVMAKLKIEWKGRSIGPRYLISTITASIIDSALFGFIGYYTCIGSESLVSLIFGMMIIKIAVYIVILPLFVYLAKTLKSIEKIDIYDRGTKFNLFTLDTTYDTSANRFVPSPHSLNI